MGNGITRSVHVILIKLYNYSAFGIFSFAWIMILICAAMLILIGKTSTGRQVEEIAN